MNQQDRNELVKELLYGKFDRQEFIKILKDAGATNEIASSLADEEQKLININFDKGKFYLDLIEKAALSNKVRPIISTDISRAYFIADDLAQEQVLSSSIATKKHMLESLYPLSVLMHESIARLAAIEARAIFIERLLMAVIAANAVIMLRYLF